MLKRKTNLMMSALLVYFTFFINVTIGQDDEKKVVDALKIQPGQTMLTTEQEEIAKNFGYDQASITCDRQDKIPVLTLRGQDGKEMRINLSGMNQMPAEKKGHEAGTLSDKKN